MRNHSFIFEEDGGGFLRSKSVDRTACIRNKEIVQEIPNISNQLPDSGQYVVTAASL